MLGGGKFLSGAITGAFSRLFNDEVYSIRHKTKTNGDITKDGVVRDAIWSKAKALYKSCGGAKVGCGVNILDIDGPLTQDEADYSNTQAGAAATHLSTAAGIVATAVTARFNIFVAAAAGAFTNEFVGDYTNDAYIPRSAGDVVVTFMVTRDQFGADRWVDGDRLIIRQDENPEH